MLLPVVIVIITALIFSAFFSGMEIAFVTSNKLKLEIERKQSRTFNYIAGVFLRRPGQYITTILVGNNIALVIYSLNMTVLLNAVAAHFGWTVNVSFIVVETIVSTIIIIFTAEFMPKAVVKHNPNFYLRGFAVPLYVIYLLLYPIAKLTTWISILLLRIAGLRIRPEHNIQGFDRTDLAHLLEEAGESEADGETESEIKLFQNAMDFSDLRVRDCMVPRVDIEAVEINEPLEVLAKQFVDTNFSRILVYEGTIDNIVGYVNIKSLFRRPKTIREVLMKVDFVPESLPAQKLLTTLTKENRSVAVVIDEFGGTAGMVSMEDILEEIFGEIEDEHDQPDMVEKVTDDGAYILSCRLEVDYLNEKYDLHIPESEEYDTLAGYIIYNYEGLPAQGEVVRIDDKEIRILRKSSSKLELARVKVVS